MKKKLLYYGDTPNVSTGFGNVARHVLSRLIDEYEITVFGVNEFFIKPNILPVKTVAALPNNAQDPFGRKKFVEFVLNSGKEFDSWFLQNDVHFWNWIPELVSTINSRGHFPHIFSYTVVDAPVREEDIRFMGSVDIAGIPSQYGVNEILKVDPSLKYKVRHIPHGIDQREFFPLPEESKIAFRKEVLGCNEDDFIIMNLNRNTVRKDISRTLIYFRELQKFVPNAKLYLHMEKNEEEYKGWDLERVINTNKIKNVSLPGKFSVNQGADISILNQMYNAVNMVISTSLGEGFGLSCVEGMATKTLVMMSDNSSLSELMADNRGIPIKCGSTPGEWVVLPNDTGWVRPIVNIEDMIAKTIRVVNNYPQHIVENAYKWVTIELPWDRVINLFKAGLNDSPEITSLEGRVIL